ncbi:MAG: (d)CMP kinase [Actinomycetota bacterium]|nr:(d)CMP kinase [Actinomycetota bacterium]
MVIAVDGPGAVGKSTVAGLVASSVGLPHLDTGSTYRAAGLAALRSDVALDDVSGILAALDAVDIRIVDGVVSIDGVDVTEALRSDDVTKASSVVATHPEVRSRIVALQRSWVEDRGGSAVVEGRDIGTVVFPDAPVKIYLTARPEIRAARRSGDAEAADKSRDEIAVELAARDHTDSTRKASPLRPADDAEIIDTSDLSIDEVVEQVLALVDGVGYRESWL